MQLTIDTSSQKIGIALSRDERNITGYSWLSQENHTRELTPGIIKLLKENNANIQDINCIIIARGPGSFNGLRVGMSVAKGLALALNVPLIGISTLAAEAYALAGTTTSLVCPLHEAGRGEIAAAIFQMEKASLQQFREEHITTVEQLHLEENSNFIFCGEITAKLAGQIKNIFGNNTQITPLPDSVCRATLIAQLGWQRFKNNDYDNPTTLQPLYLRRPPITRPKADKRIIMQIKSSEEE